MRLAHLLRQIHRDERGDEGIASKLLLFTLIALPLLALLIYFKDEISEFFVDVYKKVVGDKDQVKPDPF